MKNILLFTFIFFAVQNSGFSQSSLLNFTEEKILINGVQSNVISSLLIGNKDDLEKSIQKFTRDQLDIKLKNKDNYLEAKEVNINQITDKRGDFVVYIYNIDNKVKLNVAFKIGYDVYLSSEKYPAEFKKFKAFLEYYVYAYYEGFLPKYLKEKEKTLAGFNKDLKRAKNDKKKAVKNYQKAEKVIAKSNKKVEKLNNAETTEANDAKMQKYLERIKTAEEQISYNREMERVNEDLINNLQPEIDALVDELNAAKITNVEVKSKIEMYEK